MNDSIDFVLQHSDLTFSPFLTELIGWSFAAFLIVAVIFILGFTIWIIKDALS